jgi:uncharacterized protein
MSRGFTIWGAVWTVVFVFLAGWFLVWVADSANQQSGNTTGTDSSLQSTPIQGQNIPVPTGYVNDTAGVLSAATISDTEKKLTTFASGTNGEIAVLIVSSLNGLSIEEYGIRVGEAWKVGKYGQDNGNILIISTGDRKVRIETGSLSKITDGQAAQILAESVVPSLKKGDWNGGVVNGVDAIIKASSN